MTTKKQIQPTATEVIRSEILLLIANGKLGASGKLPSTREAAILFDCHRNTVSKAYTKLVDEGRVEARLGSGYYVVSQYDYDPENCPLYRALKDLFDHGMTVDDVRITFDLAVETVKAQNKSWR